MSAVTITRSYRCCDALKPGTYASSGPLVLCSLPAGHMGNHEHVRRDSYGLARVTEWPKWCPPSPLSPHISYMSGLNEFRTACVNGCRSGH